MGAGYRGGPKRQREAGVKERIKGGSECQLRHEYADDEQRV